ncbi:uncharacterized protein LOC122665764 [Telopea speciosissima]|uniref:uncharacterized protein LOC122665764 n=1 Tax=Telopea speciosissima TaxID=54955 RepID=UPI001CC5BF35|nr:uncharacterized protein LOC122665764 [Telopea speciosissima]
MNFIKELKLEDGRVLSNSEEIGEVFANHFHEFFKRGSTQRNDELLAVLPRLVSDRDNEMLVHVPSAEEIKAAVFDLGPSSAPGPDGFPGAFYMYCWEIVRPDVCCGVQNYFREGVVTKELKGVKSLKKFLEDYGQASGQNINLSKSKVFMGRISAARKERLLSVLQILACYFSTKYVGVELLKGRVTKANVLPLLDHFKKKLSSWKGRLLSQAGWVELVRSVIGSIPIYNFSVYYWPATTIVSMERWMSNFIWTGESEKTRAITVKWDTMCKPKNEGGLGIRRLREVNFALLAKFAWAIRSGSSNLAIFIRCRLVNKDGTLKSHVNPSTILTGLKKFWSFVQNEERWVVGSGESIRFWYDRWIGNQSIEELLQPGRIPINLSAKISDFLEDNKWELPQVESRALQSVFNKI